MTGMRGRSKRAEFKADLEARLPATVRGPGRELPERIGNLAAKIGKLDKEARKRAKESDEARRMTAIPETGPICAMAIQVFAPPMEGYRHGRDCSAWSPANARLRRKPKLDRISKMGQRDVGQLPAGGIAVIRRAFRRGTDNPWLTALLNRKPPMPTRGGADEQDGADGPGRRDEEGVVPGLRFCLGDGRRLRTEINGK